MKNALIAAMVAAIVSAGTTAAAIEHSSTTPTFVLRTATEKTIYYGGYLTALCPFGDVPTAGGFTASKPEAISQNHASYHGWRIRYHHYVGSTVSAAVYAICLKP